MAYSDAAKNSASKPHKENKFAKINYRKSFEGKLPEWVKGNTHPIKLDVKKEDGMYTKTLGPIVFYWCKKCKVEGGTAGRWNKNHPTKAHTIADDKHHSNKGGKRKSTDRSNTSTIEKLIRALEGKN